MKNLLFAVLATISIILTVDAKTEFRHSFNPKTKECKIFGAESGAEMKQVFKGKRNSDMDCLKQLNKLEGRK